MVANKTVDPCCTLKCVLSLYATHDPIGEVALEAVPSPQLLTLPF